MGSETPPPQDERRIPRAHPRVRLVTQVEATSIGHTENISEGGILVATRETFTAGTEVTVRFTIPGGFHIESQGVVVHAEPGQKMGIQFASLRDDQRKAIGEFVRQAQEK